MIISPYAEAQVSRPAPTSSSSQRNDRNNNSIRPGNNKRPGNSNNHNGTRPGSSNSNKPGTRPGNNGNHNGNYRPGSSNNRPGNNGNHNGNYRPGSNNGNHNHGGVSHWPGNSHKPSHSSPSVRPSVPHNHWSTPVPPPHRNYRPLGRPIPRPVAPHGYCPYHSAPVISSILGITFGTLYNASLDYLYHKGYEIDGYANNTIYLRNVPELGYTWPDATIFYDSYGRMANSQFVYSTSFNALGRFDRLYHSLCLTYGTPVSSSWHGTHRETIWYGGDARGYVSLEYDFSGGRYYTILSYGI